MKSQKNKLQFFVIISFSLVLCFGVAWRSITESSSILKPSKSLKSSCYQYLGQHKSGKGSIPVLPVQPFSEQTEDTEEKEENEDNNEDYFIAFFQPFLGEVFADVLKNNSTFICINFSEGSVPLYVLHHSWKNFL